MFADNSDEGTNIYLDLILESVHVRGFHALSQLSLRTIVCGIENWCPYLYRGECAGSESLIRSLGSGGDSDEFQGLSRGGKAVGEGAGRHLAGSNWLPSSRDRLSERK